MSFASSSARTPSGKYDHDPMKSASLPSPAVFEDDPRDSPRYERFRSFGRSEDKDKEPVPATRDFSDLRAKRSNTREEGEGWTPVSRTPRKSFGAEEGDRFRRDIRGDSEKKGTTPWDRDRPAKYENFGKEREREHRGGRGKRDESSWLLDDHRPERHERQERPERMRDSNRDRDNRYGGRVEKDPEWLDTPVDGKEQKMAHSMEEFQKWKERMKANSGNPDVKKKAEDTPASMQASKAKARAIPIEEQGEESPKEDSDDGVLLDTGWCRLCLLS